MSVSKNPVALITGSAKRIGAEIARTFHRNGYQTIIHYHHSAEAANALTHELNQLRSNSAINIQANLLQLDEIAELAKKARAAWQRIDVLVNNASSFYATPIDALGEIEWNDIIGTNLKAPLFLTQALIKDLKKQHGSIINIIDNQYLKVRDHYCLYSTAKAGLAMLTRSLAKELAPDIRVNAVSPGAVLPPSDRLDRESHEEYLTRTANQIPLKRAGNPADIANTVYWLAANSAFITGEIITVDGGQSL